MTERSKPVIYLTGAPASGKTTLAHALAAAIPELRVFNYGQELTQFLQRKGRNVKSQEALRSMSAGVASKEDIDELDLELLSLVDRERLDRPILIDSHPVTKEDYGFRVTPFTLERFGRLRPTEIIVLYTEPNVTLARISQDPEGRPMVTNFESSMHTGLQGTVAICYAMAYGTPIHFLNSARPVDSLASWVVSRFN